MKKQIVKSTSKSQRGFAMLEVMLAVLIIALASFGIYKLYSGSSNSNNSSSVGDIVSQVVSAVDRYTVSYMIAPTNVDSLRKAGYLAADLLNCTGSGSSMACTTVKSNFGGMTFATVSGGALNAFTLTIPNVPPVAALDLAKSMKNIAATVTIGGVNFFGDGVNADPAPTAASNIVLTFPKI